MGVPCGEYLLIIMIAMCDGKRGDPLRVNLSKSASPTSLPGAVLWGQGAPGFIIASHTIKDFRELYAGLQRIVGR
jgi:hypothetical protein